MGKRVVIGLVAMMAVVGMSRPATSSPTCLQWRTIGGSSFCTFWTTGSIRLEVKFKEACLVEGTDVSTCFVGSAQASTEDSIAFCASVSNPSLVTKVACGAPVTFTGTPVGQCEPKHEQDIDPAAPPGHLHHGCTQTVEFTPDLVACQTCCNAALGAGNTTCVDDTPIEMQTQVTVFAGGGGLLLSQSAQSCTPGSFACTVGETCTINPKKIAFHEVRPYQCNLDCAGDGCASF